MPSLDIERDGLGSWYQLGRVKLRRGEWRSPLYVAKNPVVRLSVSGDLPKNAGFVYVRFTYSQRTARDQLCYERATRYYPDDGATVIRLETSFEIDFFYKEKRVDLQLYYSARSGFVPNYSILVEELII